MSGKFAVLHYAENEEEYILDKKLLNVKNERLKDKYVEKNLPLKLSPHTLGGVEGLNVVLPLVAGAAERNPALKHDVYARTLRLLRDEGVRAVRAVEGERYHYDAMLPAVSGFYVLPFLLPLFLKNVAKHKEIPLERLEVLILDGIKDLTLDILCVIAPEINYITIFTEDKAYFQNVADHLFQQTGLSIRITDSPADFTLESADVLLSASKEQEKGIRHIKKGAVYFDLVGKRKSTEQLAASRADVTAIDGLQLKHEGAYLDNKNLELALLADDERFWQYVFGRFSDTDFYGVLDRIEEMRLSVTTPLRFGKAVAMAAAVAKVQTPQEQGKQ